MDGGGNFHGHTHRSLGDRNEGVDISSTRAEPTEADLTDDEVNERKAYTDPKHNPNNDKEKSSEAPLAHPVPTQRRRAIIGDEQGGPSSQPEASIEQIPHPSAPVSMTPGELHQNYDGENSPVPPRSSFTRPHATASATNEPGPRTEAPQRFLRSHGLVYQNYYEYGNHPQNEALKFGIPMIPLIPDTQAMNRNGTSNHEPRPGQTHTPAFMESKAWAYLKLVLHVFLVLVSISSLGLILSLIPNRDLISSSVLFSFPVPAIAIGWGFLEIMAFIFILKGRPGPGILNGILPLGQLGLSLVLALACVVAAYLQWSSISSIDRRCSRSSSRTLVYNNWQELCQTQWVDKKPSVMAIAIINIVTAAVYVVLFVIACIDTIYGKEEEE
ncbi:unnamed protein product [Clonostachys rosea]|uniref:MARVEL domain-containing protein n=1 Tax=Bionectria ochroleuca TaxID=29856 RepID=A0ABY6UDB3_BIOOC|nr:unnamed protein product [Clonostachys rosea]